MSSLPDLLIESLAAAELTERDAAAAELAMVYARQIEDGGDLAKLGPPLLAAMEALHLTPRARAAAKKAVTIREPAASPLDELAGRRAGKGRAAPVDAAAT